MNLFDYLDWRGDVPFSVDPFNEVDNLLLAQLVYTEFEGIGLDGRVVSIQEAREWFFEKHTREEVLSDSSFTAKSAFLMDEMARGKRFAGTKLCNYLKLTDKEKATQVSAITFLLEDGTTYVAFRGTDSTLVGWKEDLNLSYLEETEGQKRAVEYLNEAGKDAKVILVGGHSKGGNFAVYASAFCEKEVQDKITCVYSNDGPGFREEVLEREGYQRILPKVVSIVPDASVVGMLLSSKSKPRVIKSKAIGILQHDGFTWEILRNHFVEAELSDMGLLSEAALGDWLEKLDDDTRRSFTGTVFDILESTGAETTTDMGESVWKSLESMFTTTKELPAEKQKELLRVGKELVVSSGKAAVKTYMAKYMEKGEDKK